MLKARSFLTLSRHTCCSKGCEFVGVCEWVCRWVVMVVPPSSLEPLSGLGCDGWPEKDPEIQVSACFSSVQSSGKEKKTNHVTRLYLCSYQWAGMISKTQCCNYVFLPLHSQRAVLMYEHKYFLTTSNRHAISTSWWSQWDTNMDLSLHICNGTTVMSKGNWSHKLFMPSEAVQIWKLATSKTCRLHLFCNAIMYR